MRKQLFAGVLAGITIVASCGGDDSATNQTPTESTSETTVTPSTAEAVTSGSSAPGEAVADDPSRIVSLSPTHTEILFAIGAGDQVIAVDDQSNYPAEADAVRTELSGYEPNVEAIAGYEPDLVVASDDVVQAQLEQLGIEVWVGPSAATFDDAYAQMEQLGAVTGHVGEAAELVGQLQADLDAVVAATSASEAPLTVYHELSPDGYSADSTTFIGQVYTQLGLENIADMAEGDTGGYPQLNAETIIAADPDLIFLADTKCCGESLETVGARDGWQDMTAVTGGAVFEMDDDIASRWGPRFVEYAEAVAEAVSEAPVPAGG